MQLNKKKLTTEMKRQGLTYQALGDMLHISRQGVSYYLNNKKDMNVSTINRIAKMLNLDPKDLLI